MEEGEVAPIDLSDTRRRLWIIILFTLLAGSFSFVYCGQLGRAIRWQLGVWLVGIVSMAMMLYTPFVRLALAVLVLSVGAVYFAIIWTAKKSEQKLPWRSYQKWWAYLLIFVMFQGAAIFVADSIRAYWCEAFLIPANSMNDTILVGDRILVEKLTFQLDETKRQTLVVFRAPQDPRSPVMINYVKRLIAIGGDRVEIKSDQVFVNSQALEEPYAKYQGELDPRYSEKLQQMPEQEVPPGHAFVMGDNRWLSRDSRIFGFIPYADFIGEAKCIFWSREYKLIYASREFPQEREEFGKIRWSRIGQQLH